MLTTFTAIYISALLGAFLFWKMRLPELLGMLIAGVLLGPYCIGWLTESFVHGAEELRTVALIVILVRAGLGIDKQTLRRVGSAAALMGCIPCLCEAAFVTVAAMTLLGIPQAEAVILGFILAAVSPAVIVPQMLYLQERGYGVKKGVPTMILASACIDDVFAITLFGSALVVALGQGQQLGLVAVGIPVRIVLGIGAGFVCGYLLAVFFERHAQMRDARKVIILMIVAVLLYDLEQFLPVASLLGIMTIGFVLLEKNRTAARQMAIEFTKLWVFAEIVLFVLIGAQVNLQVALASGLAGLSVIGIGLCGRSLGVVLSLSGTDLNWWEKLFCVFSYSPKATVQAAIGAIPLSMGIASGEQILAVAALSIVVTAPLGAILISSTYARLLAPSGSKPLT